MATATGENGMAKQDCNVYEMRKSGEAGVCSSIPYCGYTPSQLKRLAKAGYKPYLNGKRIEIPPEKKETKK